MHAAFPAQAAFLHSAKGNFAGSHGYFVHPHHAVVKSPAHPPDSAHVPGEEIRSEPVRRIIGHGHGFRLAFKRHDRGQGAENLLPAKAHARSDAGEHGGLEEGGAKAGRPLASQADNRPVGGSFIDKSPHVFNSRSADQRSQSDAGNQAVARRKGAGRRAELFDKGVMNVFLHQNSVRADAGLSGITEFTGDEALHRAVQIGVAKDQVGSIAAELQRDFFHRGRALGHEFFADIRGAGKAQGSNGRA